MAAEFSTRRAGRNIAVKNAPYSPSKNKELERHFPCFSVYHTFDSVLAEIFPIRWPRGRKGLDAVLFFFQNFE